MTETEWLACTDPRPMLKFLRSKASERKLRLFACACCRRIWHLIFLAEHRGSVDMAERYADGLVRVEALAEAHETADAVLLSLLSPPDDDFLATAGLDRQATVNAADAATGVSAPGLEVNRSAYGLSYGARQIAETVQHATGGEGLIQATLLRDIIGNPFRPPLPLAPAILAWTGGTVRRMAQGIYEERAFDRLPMLADALLDAGCDNEELIQHCRSAGPHVRGCWAVDLIVGKS